jgi:pyruvate dehydrogenase E1 component
LLDVTSSDRLYRGWRSEVRDAARHARLPEEPHQLANLLDADERHVPIVTVHDAASHHLAWLGSVFGARTVPIGVDQFGQSGSIQDLYEVFDFLPGQIANAALVALAT